METINKSSEDLLRKIPTGKASAINGKTNSKIKEEKAKRLDGKRLPLLKMPKSHKDESNQNCVSKVVLII